MEFCPLAKLGEGTPAPSEEDTGPFESDSKDGPLVSEPVVFSQLEKKSKTLSPSRLGVHQVPHKPNSGRETGHLPAEAKELNCVLSAT